MKNILLILCTVAGTVYGQLVFKWQAGLLDIGKVSSMGDCISLIQQMFRPWILSAFAAMFAGTACWMLALREIPLTKAYLFVGLMFALVMIGGAVVFHERMTAGRIIGCVMIIGGVIIGSRS